MGMLYPANMLQTAIIGSLAICRHTHIGVGFGVARFDKQAMPEPQNVGRVTGDSHASFMCSLTLI